MIDLTPIMQALVSLMAALITIYFVPWLKTVTTEEQQTKIAKWVKIAVYAAEKMYGDGEGTKKLEYAKGILAEHGIELDYNTLIALVDSEIKKMELLEEKKTDSVLSLLDETDDGK